MRRRDHLIRQRVLEANIAEDPRIQAHRACEVERLEIVRHRTRRGRALLTTDAADGAQQQRIGGQVRRPHRDLGHEVHIRIREGRKIDARRDRDARAAQALERPRLQSRKIIARDERHVGTQQRIRHRAGKERHLRKADRDHVAPVLAFAQRPRHERRHRGAPTQFYERPLRRGLCGTGREHARAAQGCHRVVIEKLIKDATLSAHRHLQLLIRWQVARLNQNAHLRMLVGRRDEARGSDRRAAGGNARERPEIDPRLIEGDVSVDVLELVWEAIKRRDALTHANIAAHADRHLRVGSRPSLTEDPHRRVDKPGGIIKLLQAQPHHAGREPQNVGMLLQPIGRRCDRRVEWCALVPSAPLHRERVRHTLDRAGEVAPQASRRDLNLARNALHPHAPLRVLL